MFVTLDGLVKNLMFMQSLNAHYLILVTLAGIVVLLHP